jgi:hypothetical protein
MTDEEHIDDWLGIDEAAEVTQAYKRASQLDSRDAQICFNYGVEFMKFGNGL